MVRSDRDCIEAPWWADKPVYIIGGGPSLRGFDFRRLAALDAYVLGVNQAMFDAPCDAGLTVDQDFLNKRWDALAEAAQRIEVIIAGCTGRLPGAVNMAKNWGGGLSADPKLVMSCGSSGYAAVNAAVLKRAKKIILLGFDYSTAGGAHYHNAYPWFEPHDAWSQWAMQYESMPPLLDALGVTVLNASPDSAISCFEKVSIEEVCAYELA